MGKKSKYDIFKNGRLIADKVTFEDNQIKNLRAKFKNKGITMKLSK